MESRLFLLELHTRPFSYTLAKYTFQANADPAQPVLNYLSLGEFDDPADASGWFNSAIQVPFVVLDSALVVITTGNDPFFGRNPTLSTDYRYIEFRMKVVDGSAAPTGIDWSKDAPNRRHRLRPAVRIRRHGRLGQFWRSRGGGKPHERRHRLGEYHVEVLSADAVTVR